MVKLHNNPVKPNHVVLAIDFQLDENGKWIFPANINVNYENIVAKVDQVGDVKLSNISEQIAPEDWDEQVAAFADFIANRFDNLAVEQLGCEKVME